MGMYSHHLLKVRYVERPGYPWNPIKATLTLCSNTAHALAPKWPPECPNVHLGTRNPALMPERAPGHKNSHPRTLTWAWVPKCQPVCPNECPVPKVPKKIKNQKKRMGKSLQQEIRVIRVASNCSWSIMNHKNWHVNYWNVDIPASQHQYGCTPTGVGWLWLASISDSERVHKNISIFMMLQLYLYPN